MMTGTVWSAHLPLWLRVHHQMGVKVQLGDKVLTQRQIHLVQQLTTLVLIQEHKTVSFDRSAICSVLTLSHNIIEYIPTDVQCKEYM